MDAVETRTRELPRLSGFDATRRLLCEGNPFVARGCRELGSRGFRTRLALRQVVCVSGVAAAREFYEAERMGRIEAHAPLALAPATGGARGLFDGVLGTDGALGLDLVNRAGAQRFVDAMERCLRAAREDWLRAGRVALVPELERVLTAATCLWAGLPLAPDELDARRREFSAVIEGRGRFDARGLRALVARARGERRARRHVDAVRRLPPGTRAEDPLRLFALHQIAMHRDARDGRRLDRRTAGAELFRVLCGVVAIARQVAFAAHALATEPEARAWLGGGDVVYARAFASEVRRLYPSVALLAARAVEPFELAGHPLERGARLVLDVWGTNRDPAHHRDPDAFRPERFLDGEADANDVVPHAAPGRGAAPPLAVQSIQRAALLLAELDFRVHPDDVAVDAARMPLAPSNGLRLERLRMRERARVALAR